MNLKRKTLYKSTFQESVNEIISYIGEDSIQNAKQFAKGIKADVIKNHPIPHLQPSRTLPAHQTELVPPPHLQKTFQDYLQSAEHQTCFPCGDPYLTTFKRDPTTANS